jgi:hypothetical protein
MCCCRLPQKRVLTLNLELPESWLVEPVMALHDLDNLRLADIHQQVQGKGGGEAAPDNKAAVLPYLMHLGGSVMRGSRQCSSHTHTHTHTHT